MSKAYTIEIEGLTEMREAFAQAPEKVGKVLADTTKEAGKEVYRRAVKEAPHAFGNLQRTMHMDYQPIQVKVEPTADYARDVEFGRPPTNITGADFIGLTKWAKKKGLNPYAVRASIRKKGTKANPFMQRTRDKMESPIQNLFKKAGELIVKLLSE
jgi:hypothetical protein